MTDSKERLRNRIDVQSRQIEGFFGRRQVQGEIQRGAAYGPWVDFDLRGQLVEGVGRLRDWASELAETLGVPEIRLERHSSGLRVAVRRGPGNQADLLSLLAVCQDVPPATAVLGRDDQGQALLLTAADPDVGHVLVAGRNGSGRTALLRAIALSLAHSSRQAHLQMGIIDVDGPAELPGRRERLLPLAYLPHLMFPLAERIGEAVDALNFLAAEVEYRLEEGLDAPLMILMIDDADDLLLRGGQAVRRPLESLLAQGSQAGLRVFLAARDATAKPMHGLLRANVTVRLIGAVENAVQARAAAGLPDSYAEYQEGPGEFLAVAHGTIIPFRAAFADNYDTHLSLKRLYRHAGPVLLAKRSPAPPEASAGDEPLYFQRQNGGVFLHEDQAAYAAGEVGDSAGAVIEQEAEPFEPEESARPARPAQAPMWPVLVDSEGAQAERHEPSRRFRYRPAQAVDTESPATEPDHPGAAPGGDKELSQEADDWVYEDVDEPAGWPEEEDWRDEAVEGGVTEE